MSSSKKTAVVVGTLNRVTASVMFLDACVGDTLDYGGKRLGCTEEHYQKYREHSSKGAKKKKMMLLIPLTEWKTACVVGGESGGGMKLNFPVKSRPMLVWLPGMRSAVFPGDFVEELMNERGLSADEEMIEICLPRDFEAYGSAKMYGTQTTPVWDLAAVEKKDPDVLDWLMNVAEYATMDTDEMYEDLLKRMGRMGRGYMRYAAKEKKGGDVLEISADFLVIWALASAHAMFTEKYYKDVEFSSCGGGPYRGSILQFARNILHDILEQTQTGKYSFARLCKYAFPRAKFNVVVNLEDVLYSSSNSHDVMEVMDDACTPLGDLDEDTVLTDGEIVLRHRLNGAVRQSSRYAMFDAHTKMYLAYSERMNDTLLYVEDALTELPPRFLKLRLGVLHCGHLYIWSSQLWDFVLRDVEAGTFVPIQKVVSLVDGCLRANFDRRRGYCGGPRAWIVLSEPIAHLAMLSATGWARGIMPQATFGSGELITNECLYGRIVHAIEYLIRRHGIVGPWTTYEQSTKKTCVNGGDGSCVIVRLLANKKCLHPKCVKKNKMHEEVGNMSFMAFSRTDVWNATLVMAIFYGSHAEKRNSSGGTKALVRIRVDADISREPQLTILE